MQVLCRTCGVHYPAYNFEYKGDNKKRPRRDRVESAAAEVKDKGGACPKYMTITILLY